VTLKELINEGIVDEWTPEIPIRITEIKETKNRTKAEKKMTKCKITDRSGEIVGCWIYTDEASVNLQMSLIVKGMLKEYQGKRYLDYCKVVRVLPSGPQDTPQTPQNPPQSPNALRQPTSADIRIKAARIAATALGGTGVDTAPEVACKIIDVAGLLVDWLEKGQPPTFGVDEPPFPE